MRNYEVTFIVDPVLASEEIKATAQTYVDLLKSKGCEIVHINEMGLRQFAFAIGKRHSGAYYCVEFKAVDGSLINDFELAFRRDERIITVDHGGHGFGDAFFNVPANVAPTPPSCSTVPRTKIIL